MLIFNLWHKKRKKNKIRGYITIHTFTKRIEDKTNDNNNKNNNKSNNNNNISKAVFKRYNVSKDEFVFQPHLTSKY